MTYHEKCAKLLRYGAIICVLLIALGAAKGLHLSDPDAGFLVPIVTGVVIAIAFGVFWHVMIISSERTRSPIGKTAIIILGVVGAIAAIGLSASNIAIAMAGKASLSAELSDRVDSYVRALSDADVAARSFQPLVDVAAAAGATLQGKADIEERGINGTGSGCGQRCETYRGTAASFARVSSQLQGLVSQVDILRNEGLEYVANMRRSAITADQEGFSRSAQNVSLVVDRLNAVNHMPIVSAVGLIEVSELSSELTPETETLQRRAREIQEDRKRVEIPTFVPISVGEATRNQMSGVASQAWIAAISVDVLPLIFVLVVLFTAMEPLLREHTPRSPTGVIEVAQRTRDEENAVSGKKENLKDQDALRVVTKHQEPT